MHRHSDLNRLYVKTSGTIDEEVETEVCEIYRVFLINGNVNCVLPTFDTSLAQGVTIATESDILRYCGYLLSINKIYCDYLVMDIGICIDGEIVLIDFYDNDSNVTNFAADTKYSISS